MRIFGVAEGKNPSRLSKYWDVMTLGRRANRSAAMDVTGDWRLSLAWGSIYWYQACSPDLHQRRQGPLAMYDCPTLISSVDCPEETPTHIS